MSLHMTLIVGVKYLKRNKTTTKKQLMRIIYTKHFDYFLILLAQQPASPISHINAKLKYSFITIIFSSRSKLLVIIFIIL